MTTFAERSRTPEYRRLRADRQKVRRVERKKGRYVRDTPQRPVVDPLDYGHPAADVRVGP